MNLYILGASSNYQGWGFVVCGDTGAVYALPPIGEDCDMVDLVPVSNALMEIAMVNEDAAQGVLNDYETQLASILG